MENPQPSSSLLSVEALSDLLDQGRVKVFDVRGIWGKDPRPLPEDYLKSHIPTSIFLDWRREFIEPHITPTLAQVSSFEEAKQSFKNLGIHKTDRVILYDDYHHMFAGRIWWAMRYWGFENVQVLNGGFNRWRAQGLPISQEVPETLSGSFEPVRQAHLRMPLEEFLVEKNKACVLDGRGLTAYKGKPEDPRTGHIPGAISAAYNSLLDPESGCFLEDGELISRFDKEIPNWRNQQIISSCGAGYSGTVVMLALAHLGIQSSLFDGSFAVWKQDPSRPIEQSL